MTWLQGSKLKNWIKLIQCAFVKLHMMLICIICEQQKLSTQLSTEQICLYIKLQGCEIIEKKNLFQSIFNMFFHLLFRFHSWFNNNNQVSKQIYPNHHFPSTHHYYYSGLGLVSVSVPEFFDSNLDNNET